jgi:hypothetical protein
MQQIPKSNLGSLDDVYAIDTEARRMTAEIAAKHTL